MTKLVIVESPSKVKTITKFLGNGYQVAASYGHIADLPKSELGVDTEKSYKPKYVLSNKKAIKLLKSKFVGIDTLIIASDPDREGEAIGWHVAQRLGVITPSGKKKGKVAIKRIVFTSITKDAVLSAIKNPRSINMDLIDAQQARRVLDRLVGYKLSPLLWKKIRFGLSAGRVQSVALRIITDREEERDAFLKEEYWSIEADLSDKSNKIDHYNIINAEETKPDFKNIKFELSRNNGKKVEIHNRIEAKKILDMALEADSWCISGKKTKESKRNPKPPFITSTLQQASSNIFGYSAKKTMVIAQKLYENGHITYMRTDSLTIVPSEIENIRRYVGKKYGKKYLSDEKRVFTTSSKNAQEAHEAIRPTKIAISSSQLKLNAEQEKLYDLIRKRVLATQMSPAIVENTTLQIKVSHLLFKSNGLRIVFDGFLKVYPEKVSENILPNFVIGDEIYLHNLFGLQHFTKPPGRFTEATLIKILEKYGIGRPSTYAPTISTIIARKYVEKEGRSLVPTDTGKVVIKLLKKYFTNIIDFGFTAGMEDDLDSIAEGKLNWTQFIDKFYKPFIKEVENGDKKIGREEFTVLGDAPKNMKCPTCKKKMVVKLGRYGRFYSCSKFPDCKGIRGLDGSTEEDRAKVLAKKVVSKEFKNNYKIAPKTKDGRSFNLRASRYGEYWAHPDYPKKKVYLPLEMKKTKIISLYGKPPKTKEGKDFVFRSGRYGKYWAHPDYPKTKKTFKIKEETPDKPD